MTLDCSPRIVVALDYADAASALTLARQLDPKACRVKVGKELFTRAGPAVVEQLQALGFNVFLDLKFHDIPNTVAQAVRAAAELGVWMVNVHASGGRHMMEATRERVEGLSHRPLLIAVTVLTSMQQEALAELGVSGTLEQHVLRLAALTRDSGFDGVVSSAQEVKPIKQACGTGFLTVTPGIRPASAAADDQARILTPAEAVAIGSDYLVVGRPITRSPDPLAALHAIRQEIGEVA